ncbi:hypothetical protein ABZV64_08515 [Streptomyces sp. NPDC004959]|uniref:hypothetical protein n=1 Tax=unclassified Streptomyces TaxID=2593676 RepID=UPI0004C9D16C|nr:hypothetical protein [Streptomyces sp. NRRL F-5630]
MTFKVGAYVVDTVTGTVGIVEAAAPEVVVLRPIGGGPFWGRGTSEVRLAETMERLRAETLYLNARSRGERL